MGKAYVVVIDNEGCKCGAGRTYTIVGPDRVAFGRSWADLEEAQWIANELNEAYEEGLKAQRQ